MSGYDQAFADAARGQSASPYDQVFKDIMPKVPEPPASSPAVVKAGAAINNGMSEFPRQLGLTARYGIEGLANLAQVVTEPIRYGVDRATELVTGKPANTVPLGVLATQTLDSLGWPSPKNATERVIADATRLVSGAGGAGAAAKMVQGVTPAAQFLATNSGLPGFAQIASPTFANAGEMFASNMAGQAGSAIGAGLAGGSVREAGGSPLAQGVASLGGGVAGGLIGPTLSNAVGKVWDTIRQPSSALPASVRATMMDPQQLDARINVVLQSQGIDPATVSPAVHAQLREQVGRALQINDGGLNADAVGRLADYTRLGLTPTRARLTLNPYDVTQEANASKLAAATGARDAQLPQIANDNNRRLVSLVDEMGGARPVDPYGQGNAVIAPIRSADAAMSRDVRAAYDAYRQSTGRDLPIPLEPMRQGYQQTLRDFGDVIPSAIRGRFEAALRPPPAPPAPDPMRQIVGPSGNVLADLNPRPAAPAFSINEAEDLIKAINRNYNPMNRAEARALDDLRRTVQNAIIGATDTGAGMESATLANFARDTARQRFQWRDSSPVIQRALGGANPDTFVQNNIISKAAGFDDVARAAATINADPAARDAVRVAIVQKLKESALGRGGTSETGNFSGRGMEAALRDIGERKLGLFFSPEEVATMRAMARTGSFEVFQPRGSAVNNSNTAANAASILMRISDRVRPLASKIPFGDAAITRPLDNTAVWLAQRPAQNIPRSLLLAPQPQPRGLLMPGAGVGLAAGGLLAAP